MRDVWLRILIAATLSMLGVLCTFTWSLGHRKPAAKSDEPPLARILLANNDVQRRPAERLIWQSTLKAEELHSGEAIRTGAKGSARIEFIGKNAYADLDQDTVIEIEKTRDGLNLDFLIGNIVVHSADSGSATENNKITVQSGEQKLVVKNSDVAVAKATSVAMIDFEVIKGQAKVEGPGAETYATRPKPKLIKPKQAPKLIEAPLATKPAAQNPIVQKDQPLQAPVPVFPANESKVPFLTAREDGVSVSWKPMNGVASYAVRIIGPGRTYEHSTPSSKFNVKKLPPGQYRWSLVAIENLERVSPESPTRTFIVEENPVLAWADGLTKRKYISKTERPLIKLAWQKGPADPKRWRLRIIDPRQPASEPEWKYTEITEAPVSLNDFATYQAEVESLDSNGEVIARTQTRTIQMEMAPPLSAPEFSPPGATPLRGGLDGSADLIWKPIEGAKRYVIQVQSPDGKVVQTVTSETPRAAITGLKSGDYTVGIQTIDAFERTGPKGSMRLLEIPEFSSIRAPKIKAVKVQ